MLILNETDILQAIDLTDLLESAEKALVMQEKGQGVMPDRMHVAHEGNVHLLMPAIGLDYAATKLVSVHPRNKEIKLPALHGVVLLQDGKTGMPLALINGAKLTALRTGAVGALGLAYTAPKDLETLGLVGAGVQGFHQALFAGMVRNLKQIEVHDPFLPDMGHFIEKLGALLPGTEIREQPDIRKLVENSGAIITATTSLEPVIPDDAGLIEGRHFIGIGSYRPDMREFPEALFRQLDHLIIDTPLARKESGDVSFPLEKGWIHESRVCTLGAVITGKVAVDDAQTTFFKSVGMALFDLTAAGAIYRAAKEKGIGREVEF